MMHASMLLAFFVNFATLKMNIILGITNLNYLSVLKMFKYIFFRDSHNWPHSLLKLANNTGSFLLRTL